MLPRRALPAALGGALIAGTTVVAADEKGGPVESPFARDYEAPGFKPGWKKPQVNRQFVQDFVIYAHSDLEMTKKLLAKEPALLNAFMDWGNGDWESALGGASHMGRGGGRAARSQRAGHGGPPRSRHRIGSGAAAHQRHPRIRSR